ncbi:MAG: two-component system regulatory protein YycI [Enterococcus sp.]
MDFKKIEWIFFLAFLGLNIFLFSIFHDAQTEATNVTSTNQKIDIATRLKEDDITFNGELSGEQPEGYYLSAEQTDLAAALTNEREKTGNDELLATGTSFEDDLLNHVIYEEYVVNEENPQASIADFLASEDQVLYGSEYTYQPVFSVLDAEYPELIASQSFEGVPFHDVTSQIEISLGTQDDQYRLQKYTQSHISNIEKLREKMKLYSEKEALNTLYTNNKIPSDSTILWSQLGYTLILQVREKNVYVPAWFVAIQTGEATPQVEIVNAVNNRIITNNSLQQVENS